MNLDISWIEEKARQIKSEEGKNFRRKGKCKIHTYKTLRTSPTFFSRWIEMSRRTNDILLIVFYVILVLFPCSIGKHKKMDAKNNNNQVIRPENSDNWTLQIKFPQIRDSGIYECQVNTEPKMSMAFRLNIVGEY